MRPRRCRCWSCSTVRRARSRIRRALPRCSLERIRRGQKRKLTILVATSGDTGSAVAAAFHGKPWVDVAVLYPQGRVSDRQAQQLACWGGNVRTFAVRGSFDDCQRIVKEAFADPALAETHQLSSANSINIGRLLPQMVYFARRVCSCGARAAGVPTSSCRRQSR
jgi:threonine synthase